MINITTEITTGAPKPPLRVIALWPCWAGMWLSSMVLLPIGIFLTYKAATDSALFNPEVWLKVWEKVTRQIRVKASRLVNVFRRS